MKNIDTTILKSKILFIICYLLSYVLSAYSIYSVIFGCFYNKMVCFDNMQNIFIFSLLLCLYNEMIINRNIKKLEETKKQIKEIKNRSKIMIFKSRYCLD